MNMSQLAPFQVAMLACGIVLFVVGVGLIVFLTCKQRSTKPALVILPLAILMIGFPSVQSFKGLGFEVTVAAQTVAENARTLEQNPGDERARRELTESLARLESNVSPEKAQADVAAAIAEGHDALGHPQKAIQWANVAIRKDPNSETARLVLNRVKVNQLLPADLDAPLPSAARSNLSSAARDLSSHRNLSPSTRLTLAKAQLALGQTNAAKTNLQHAVQANTNLVVSPEVLRRLDVRAVRRPNP